jgi:hypothetical protein
MEFVELTRLKKKRNLEEQLKNQPPNFKMIHSELYQEEIFKKMKTLCFDIENVFIRSGLIRLQADS